MKFKKTLLAFCLIMCIFFCVSSVAAGDVNDTLVASEDQNVIENQDPVAASEATAEVNNQKIENDVISSSNGEILNAKDNGTFTALQEKINNAEENATITLENDYAYDEGFSTGGISISKALTIDGKGFTIDALNKSRIFNIGEYSVTLKNIVFCNADGGAVNNCGIVVNCTFINNHASRYGGAIYNCSDVVNCRFINNHAVDTYESYGGAIYKCGNVVNCSFVDNYVSDDYANGRGGAIYSCFDVVNCSFDNNKANKGGAIYSSGEVVNCSFVSNFATYGGAIYSSGDVVNCSFKKNRAYSWGGAIYSDSSISILNCSFVNNYAESDGGAICYWENVNSTVLNCSFVNNSAYTGGAVYCYNYGGYSKIHVLSCEFVDNSATSDYNDNCGGAISGCSDVVNCSFIGNHAKYLGGAIIGSSNVVNCSFVSNSATNGGAIYSASSLSVFNCSFVSNSARHFGGAIYSDEDSLSVLLCSFVGNSAEEYGGAVYCYDSDASVSLCNFVGNSAELGGAIANCNYVADCTFSNNSAEQGGAVCWCDNVVGCSFVKNTANEHGGAIFSSRNVVDCSFTDNSANDQGGAISYSDNMTNCSFVSNYANRGAAVFYGWDDEGYILNCSFVNNSAKYDGGALCNSIHVEKSSFIDNVANGKYNVYCLSYDLEDFPFNNLHKIFTDCDIRGEDLSYSGILNWENNKLILRLGYDMNSSVSIKISGKTFNPTYKKVNGKYYAYFDVKGVEPGINNVNIFYDGNLTDSPIDITLPAYIGSQISISSSDVEMCYGGSDKFTVTLKDGDVPLSDESVDITVNGKVSSVKTDSKGQASVDLKLPVGEYDASAVYGHVSTTSKVTVKSTLTVSNATGTYLNSKVSATFLNTNGKALASKQVTFKVNGRDYTATTNGNGVAAADIDLGAGTYTVTAVNPVNNEQKEFKLVISKAASKIALTSAQSGEVVTLTAALTPAAATGSVIFNVNGENNTATIKSGKATLALSDLKAGNYTVTAFYNGDNNLDASASNTISFSVSDVYPVLTAKGVTKTYGTATKLVVYLKDNKGNAIAGANVNVDINDKVTPITTNSNGQATMAIGQAPGTYYAKITYPKAKQVTAKIVVKKATPKLTAKAKTFKKSLKTKIYTITLKTNTNKVMKNSKVTLKVNGKTYKATTNTKGQATFKITKLTKKGKFTAVVKYAGSKYYNAKTVKPKITIK